MFEFFGNLLQSTGVAIGTVLISISALLGVHTTVEQPTLTPTQELESNKEESVKATDKATPLQTAPSQTQPKSSITAQQTLQIENVKSTLNENQAQITWTTSLPAESRLIFDNGEGRVFESESGISTTHKVHTTGLQESEEYDYKITATTADKSKSDDYFDTLYMTKKYTASFGTNENECQIIVLKDTAGHIAANKKVYIAPYQKTGDFTYTKGNIEATSNSRGEIKYCDVANTFKLTGENLSVTISSI